MMIPLRYAVADVMARLKRQSVSQLRAKVTWLSRVYFKENVFCPQGYFVSSVGLDGEKIKHYVEFQGRQDVGQLRLEL